MKSNYVTTSEFRRGISRLEKQMVKDRAENKKEHNEFRQMFVDLSVHVDKRINETLIEQRIEFQRYLGALTEEFQSRLSGVIEMYVQNSEDIKIIKARLQLA